CIVSSDSDFTRLATRLREAGMLVIGLGERKTPSPFIAACNKFIYLEILKHAESEKSVVRKGETLNSTPSVEGAIDEKSSSSSATGSTKAPRRSVDKVDKSLVNLLVNSVD